MENNEGWHVYQPPYKTALMNLDTLSAEGKLFLSAHVYLKLQAQFIEVQFKIIQKLNGDFEIILPQIIWHIV